MCPTPTSSILRAVGCGTTWPATATSPLDALRSPVIASISSLWPLASTPAIPTIPPVRRCRLLDPKQHLAADHHLREPFLGRALARNGVDHLPAAQDGDPVGDL